MFSGELLGLRLRFENRFVGAVLDRFGSDTVILPVDDEHFTVCVSVAVSPKFFAWLYGFGTAAEILAPDSVREQFRRTLIEAAEMYE